MNRPSFLLVSADQQRGDCLGVEGRRIKTPHLDRLAAQGTRFTAAITPCVVCQPARASILTGLLPCTHGVHDNGIDLDPAIGERGFAGALAGAGYDTAFFGKAHFATYHTFGATGTPEGLISSADYGPDWHGPYMGFSHVEIMVVGHNWFPPEVPPKGQHYECWFHADGRGAEKIRAYRRNMGDTKGAAQTWHSGLPVAWHNSTWTGRPGHRMAEAPGARRRSVLHLGELPRPPPPLRLPGTVVAPARSGGRRPATPPPAHLRRPPVVAREGAHVGAGGARRRTPSCARGTAGSRSRRTSSYARSSPTPTARSP